MSVSSAATLSPAKSGPATVTQDAMYSAGIGSNRYIFPNLAALLAKASPLRSGDVLAGLAADSEEERVAAQVALADVPLRTFLEEHVIPYEIDEVTRLIVDSHDHAAFAAVAHLTVGGLRDWLLSDAATTETLAALAPGITPEMAAAVAKIMRDQDLILMAAKCRVVTRFRNTLGLAGCLSVRLQPNHPTDDPRGIAAAILDGLLLGAGDAVIGINPATDSPERTSRAARPARRHTPTTRHPDPELRAYPCDDDARLIGQGAPVDLVFQSIAGTRGGQRELRRRSRPAARGARGGAGAWPRHGRRQRHVFRDRPGQRAVGRMRITASTSRRSKRAPMRWRGAFKPLLVNTVVGFIGPEYLYDGKQIIRAGLEDHFCGKLLGLPMGCDVCYTNHAEADQDDMDALLTLLVAAGVNYIMGVPGADDIMLGYQSTSFHDALAMRELFGRRPAPEFEAWLRRQGLLDASERVRADTVPRRLHALLSA